MNKQEIFTKVYNHLLGQNAKATLVSGNCAYRGEGGTKCAVGCLIDDEDYDPKMEGIGVNKVLRDFPRITEKFAAHLTLLQDLQHIHDECPVTLWPELLRDIASRYNLEVPAT